MTAVSNNLKNVANADTKANQFLACSSSTDYPWSDGNTGLVIPEIQGVNGSSSQLSGKTPEVQDQDASAGASAHNDRGSQGSEPPEPALDKAPMGTQGAQNSDHSKAARDLSRRTPHTSPARDRDGIASSSRHRDALLQSGEYLETPSDDVEAADLGHRELEPPKKTPSHVSDPGDIPAAQDQVTGAAMETHRSSPGHSSNTLKSADNGVLNGELGDQNPGRSTEATDPIDQITDQDLRRFLVHHYFDYVAGTSTGG